MSEQMHDIVPIRRAESPAHYSDDVKARCFILYSTFAARNASHTARLYREEMAGTDEPTPSRETIALWARTDHWAEQGDDLQRNTRDWMYEQLRVLSQANQLLAEKVRHDVLIGEYEGREMQGALRLKASELADRKNERLLPLDRLVPPSKPRDTSTMSQEEKEAYNKSQLIQRKRGSA